MSETSSSEVVQVALLSASADWCEGVAALLAEHRELAYLGSAADTDALRRLSSAPDVLVVDAFDSEAVEDLLMTGPPALPLVVSIAAIERETAWRVLRLGAAALIERGPFGAELVAAIHAVMGGLCTLSRAHLATLMQATELTNGTADVDTVERLTPRELQILRMLSEGLANKAIAAQLAISEHTAKYHVGQILAKLGAETRTEAVTTGIRRGLITL
jgi:two-component system, NarL family, response regulator YdfI